MANSTAEAINQIRTALGEGNAQAAWPLIEPILRFPESQSQTPDQLLATWAFFQKTVVRLNFGSLEPLIDNARNQPDNAEVLLALGRELLAHDLGALAATPLSHASRLVGRAPLAPEVHEALAIAMQSTTPQ